MKKNHFLTWIFLLLPCLLWNAIQAQSINFDQYQPLSSKGPIPKDFITPSSVKYKDALKKISSKDSRRDKKAQKRFYLESNFLIDDMLRSGYVLFNDPLSEYVAAVADNLLKEDANLRKKLNFYVLRSSDVNAFATDQGAILVTTGLLSQIENEAQLAFVLAHEITHFQRKHTLNLFLEVDRINRGTSQEYVAKKATFDKSMLKKSYSRDLETQADKEGLERYLKTGYDLNTVDGVFDVLAYSELPFDDQHFQTAFFENDYLKFPPAYSRSDIRPISPIEEDEDDKDDTHPNFKKRRETVAGLLKSASNNGRTAFILPEARFHDMQKMARFEVPLLSLHQEEYYRAIYEAWLSLKASPGNFYLQKCILKGMYTASKYRNTGLNYQVSVDSIEGELQGLVHFFEKLNNQQMAILLVAEAWRLRLQQPQDEEVKLMSNDALHELLYYYVDNLDGFSKEKAPPPVEEKVDSSMTAAPKTEKEKSKYEKIREKKKEAPKEGISNLFKYALAPYLEQPLFQEELKKTQEGVKKRKDRKAYNESEKGQAEWRKKQRNKVRKGQRLGISQVVIVNPFYLNLDQRKKNSVQYQKSEMSQDKFIELLKDNAQKVGLKANILDIDHLKTSDVEKFNDIALLNQWFAEQTNFENLTITPGFRQAEINAIAKKYGTKYFCWTGVISLRERKSYWPYFGIILGPVVWPFIAAHAVKREYDCMYYNVVYNAETGGYDSVKFEYFNAPDSKSLLNLHTYDAFLQLKSK